MKAQPVDMWITLPARLGWRAHLVSPEEKGERSLTSRFTRVKARPDCGAHPEPPVGLGHGRTQRACTHGSLWDAAHPAGIFRSSPRPAAGAHCRPARASRGSRDIGRRPRSRVAGEGPGLLESAPRRPQGRGAAGALSATPPGWLQPPWPFPKPRRAGRVPQGRPGNAEIGRPSPAAP